MVAADRLGRQLPERPVWVAEREHTREPSVGDQTLVPSAAGPVRRQVEAVAVALPSEQLLGSTADIARGPCMLSSHHDRLIFHSGYTRIPQVGWGDNSIAPVEVLGLGHRH